MDEKRNCASCSYFDMDLGAARGKWYACSLHKEYIEDDSQAETCPDFWKIFTPKPEPDPLDGVPFVSLSNEEIAAMTPEHPLYKLVKGKEERNGQ